MMPGPFFIFEKTGREFPLGIFIKKKKGPYTFIFADGPFLYCRIINIIMNTIDDDN